MSTFRFGLSVLVFALSTVAAQESWADPPAVNAETVTRIEELGSEDFFAQSKAMRELERMELEEAAIPLLQKTADTDDIRATHFAIRILSQAAKGDSEVAKSARKALDELSESNKPHVAVGASHALAVLNLATNRGVPNFQPGFPRRLNQGQQRSEKVNSSTVNGQRRIEVKTPNQLIEINDRDGRDIHVNVTQTASGEQATYDAQDIKDLKQQNAEIAQLYEKYTKPAVNNVQGFGEKPALAGPPPGLPRDINPSGGKKAKEAHQQIEKCLTRLAKVNTALKEMKKESFDESKLTALLEELDAAKKELFAAQAQLE